LRPYYELGGASSTYQVTQQSATNYSAISNKLDS
jgi:hypothetical protein